MVLFGIHSPRFHRIKGPRFLTFFELIDDIDSSGEPLGDLGEPTDMIPPGALGGSLWPKEFLELSPVVTSTLYIRGGIQTKKGPKPPKKH